MKLQGVVFELDVMSFSQMLTNRGMLLLYLNLTQLTGIENGFLETSSFESRKIFFDRFGFMRHLQVGSQFRYIIKRYCTLLAFILATV